jgi:hypothetical protein
MNHIIGKMHLMLEKMGWERMHTLLRRFSDFFCSIRSTFDFGGISSTTMK